MITLQKPGQSALAADLRGVNLLNRPILNKGTAFTEDERDRLGLHGLLPPQVESLDQQVIRAYEALRRKDDDLERHVYLRALQDANEVHFYRLLLDHIEEMTPSTRRWSRRRVSSSATSADGPVRRAPARAAGRQGRGPGDRDSRRPGGAAGQGRAEDKPGRTARSGSGRAVGAGVPRNRARHVISRRKPTPQRFGIDEELRRAPRRK